MSAHTYTKLRSGAWGVRGPLAEIGAVVDVRKRSGEIKREKIAAIVWRGDGVALMAIAQASRRGGGCHTDGECSSLCSPADCPCGDGGWFRCC